MPKAKFLFVAVVLLGFLSRALPHPPNFTPILAMAIVAGAFAARKWVALILPLLAMLLSDLLLNNTLYASFYPEGAGLGSVLDNGFTYAALAVLALLPLLLPGPKPQLLVSARYVGFWRKHRLFPHQQLWGLARFGHVS